MKTPKILKKINKNNICYFESSINYTLLFMYDGSRIISGYNIKFFEELLDFDFVRINRSKCVNVAFITKTIINDKIYAVQLANGEEINISRRRVNKLKEEYPMMF